MGNMQSSLVPPSSGITNQAVLENPQPLLEVSAGDNQLDNNYVDSVQEDEPEPLEQQEPGKLRYLLMWTCS